MYSIDVFCRVVDNYGDIGVCWRLVRQLSDYGPVRLFIDDLAAFARIEPLINPHKMVQSYHRITICHWDQAHTLSPAQWVIESFGCDLPSPYIEQMPLHTSVWVNLEYLSAEEWVEAVHGLPSPQPNRVDKYFFFPGFTPRTGGLLRPFQQTTPFSWEDIGVPAPRSDRVAFVFSYPNAPISMLYQALAQRPESWTVYTAATTPAVPAPAGLAVHTLPYLAQAQFDQLLDLADLNIVRGEDSFVRAIWAAKPFIWQPYIQEENTHLIKLQAWLERTPFTPTIQQLIEAWNQSLPLASALNMALDQYPTWQQQCRQYASDLAQQTDLARQLVAFCSQIAQNKVK